MNTLDTIIDTLVKDAEFKKNVSNTITKVMKDDKIAQLILSPFSVTCFSNTAEVLQISYNEFRKSILNVAGT